jgi:hypothetical protein
MLTRARAARRANANFLDKAIEMVKEAIELDTKQSYAEAYKQYMNSLDYFMMALKCECSGRPRHRRQAWPWRRRWLPGCAAEGAT